MGIKCYAYLDFMYVFVVLYRLVLLLLLQAEARRKLYHRTYLRIAWKIPSHREGRNWVSKLWNSWLPKQLKADANFIPASRKHGREGREGRDGRHGLPGPVGRAGDYPEFVSPFDVENEPNPEFYQFWDLSATTSNHNNEDPPRTTDFDDGILPRTALGHDAAFIWEDMFDDQSVFLGLDTGLDDPVKGKTTSKPDTGSSLNTIILPHVGLGLGCNDLRGHIDGGHKCTYCSDSFTNKGQLRKHVHRKHEKRYRCGICDRVFGLRSDLKRHKNSIHESASALPGFVCDVEGCRSAGTKWLRKDHFTKHVKRCESRKHELTEIQAQK